MALKRTDVHYSLAIHLLQEYNYTLYELLGAPPKLSERADGTELFVPWSRLLNY